MFRAIVLDFDGVVLESVAIKARAFRDLVPASAALQDRMERYHLENLGLSRYEKFAWMSRELLGRALTQAEAAALDRRFGAAIAVEMRQCPFVEGALEFLHAHAGREPLFVASATPETELRGIIGDRGLTAFFSEIYGAPISKVDALTRISEYVGGAPREVLFIGDGRQDAEAAEAVGVTFVARIVGSGDVFGDVPAMRVATLAELDKRLGEIVPARS